MVRQSDLVEAIAEVMYRETYGAAYGTLYDNAYPGLKDRYRTMAKAAIEKYEELNHL